MAESESSDIVKINTLFDNSISLLSIQYMEGIDELEDHFSSLRAVIGDLEIQKLLLSDPAAASAAAKTVPELARQMEMMYVTLDRLFNSKEVRNFINSPLNRVALGLKKRQKIRTLNWILGRFRNGNGWTELESCVLKNIKKVVNNTAIETNYPAIETAGERESDKLTITGLLLDDSKTSDYVQVLSIYGAGGLGKSKLARSVFDYSSIVDEFESRLWVYVGDEFDVRTIIEKVIECIVGSRTEDLPIETLKDLLEKLILEKKFLLVLDDVMNMDDEKWDELMECLKGGGDGSRVIVVSREESIASRVSTLKKYELGGLSLNESLSLWDLDVPEGVEPLVIEQIKDKILSKCDQKPLAIELIGKVLRYRPLETELLPFMREVLGKLDDPVFQLGTGDKKISPALPLSYSYLPPQLQRCFLYCGLFPKSVNIDVQKLIHHWIAQQYIIRPEGAEESMEEIGLEFFYYLVRRSFLKEGEMDETGNIISCQLENSMHDLANSIAGSGHRMFRSSEIETFDDIQTRHVSFLCHFNSKLAEKCSFDAPRLRTFLLLRQDILRSNEGKFRDSFAQDMFTKFQYLYVCDLHSSGIAKLPSTIENLKCLRYLDISENDEIKTLPNSITKLRYLEVLNVSGCQMLMKLPKGICKLVNLRHLYCHRCWNLKYMPRGIGDLTQLRTLSWFVVAEDSSLFPYIGRLEELSGLQKLRQLGIRNLKYLRRGKSECEKAKLKEKPHLQSLTLRWNHDEDDEGDDVADNVDFDLVLQPNPNLKRLKVRDYKGVNFPIGFSLLKNLVHISIRNCGRCKRLPALDHIETLQCLSIGNLPRLVLIDYNEDKARCNVALFKSLKELHLFSCRNLKGWLKAENDTTVIGVEHFPSLSQVEIKNCPNFKPEFPNAQEKPSPEYASGGPFSGTGAFRKMSRQSVRRNSAIIREMLQDVPLADQSGEVLKSPIRWKTSATIQDVEHFPEELLKNLSSFQKLHINCCPNLLSLPQALQQCTSLQELEISGCPELEARCGNENSADWPIVSHIPYIQINAQFVKWDGHFQPNRNKTPFLVPRSNSRQDTKSRYVATESADHFLKQNGSQFSEVQRILCVPSLPTITERHV